jgi:SNF2 family DNA or RNA helicase
MGTGKTHEAIQLDLEWYKKNAGPTLIIAPYNTLGSWRDKYYAQSPETDVEMIDRKNRDKLVASLKKGLDVGLMHWEALRLMPELRSIKFNLVVADEVHRASNRKAQMTRALKGLYTKHRLAMSGTASGDKPENIWSVLNWLWPSYYKSYWKFRNYYTVQQRSPEGYWQVVGTQHLNELHREMSPWYVRHLKRGNCCTDHPDGVMSWLTEPSTDTIWVDLSPQQRNMYDQMRKHMVAWIGEHEDEPLTAGVVVAQLTRLSQIALATPYFDKTYRYVERVGHDVEVGAKVRLTLPSSKLDAIYERVADNPGKKFVLYSSSRQFCYLAQKYFQDRGIKSFVLSGDTPDSHRDGMVERFCNDDTQMFIGVIEAAAEGIDGLQHATDTAIFADRSWRTIKNYQAQDRLDRGGQLGDTEFIDVMARGTIDLGRHQKLGEKWFWIKTILGDKFSNEELERRGWTVAP